MWPGIGLIVVGCWWLVIDGQAPGEYPPPIVKTSRFDRNRLHRALIQKANEPEEKRRHCLSRVSGEFARARG